MHREIRSIEKPLAMESSLPLYGITLLTAILLALDLWPLFATWLNSSFGLSLPVGSTGFQLGSWTLRWATIAAMLGGARALITALESLLAGRTGADLALALAVLAALFLNQPLVAAEVVLIGLIGECLEAYTFGRTQHAIRGLVETFPKMCLVYRDGVRVMIPLDDVLVGETIEVLPGKRIPVDGIIQEGTTTVDQSNLTGESVPVEKLPGQKVLAGTVNQMGNIKVLVQQISHQTIMGQVIDVTAKALQAKGQGERTADRLARYFLPVVLLIALLTFLVNWWLLRGSGQAWFQAAAPALAVLVVACPCALILATPAATMAALARLAKTGVLVKRGLVLEQLADVKRIVFDKTGTLTTAQLSVGKILTFQDGVSEAQLLQLAASIEQASEHPLAQAIVNEAKKRQLTLQAVPSVTITPGLGLSSESNGLTTLLGNEAFLREAAVNWNDSDRQQIEHLSELGQTVILVAQSGKLLGVIGLWDTVRPEAASVVEQLRQLNIEVALLSGDRAAVVKNIASTVGIAEAQSDCLPAEKSARLVQWKQQGKVAMIGDGVNDAPALASADVGLAVSSLRQDQITGAPRLGSDIAADCSDIVLMGEPLASLPLLVRLSREMVRIIQQNIVWFAFGVNVVGIALVAWLIPSLSPENRERSPLYAAIYHQIGSLLVLLNSMRLLWFEKPAMGWVQQLSSANQRWEGWLEQFNLHDASHWLYERRRGVGMLLLGLVLLGYLASSIQIVPAGSVGVVSRCGAVQTATLPPGLHLQLPWPWDRVTLLEKDQVRRVEIGFRRMKTSSDTQTWSSEHRDNLLLSDDEALLLTADGNLIEVQAALTYTVADAGQYLVGVANIEGLLRAQAEAALREVAAERRFEQLLTSERAAFQQDAFVRLQTRLHFTDQYLSIHLQSLALEDLHPPAKVVKDYYEVTRALAARSRLVTEARIDSEKIMSRELVVSSRMNAESEGEALARLQRTRAERDAFLSLVDAQAGLCTWHLVPMPVIGFGVQAWPASSTTLELAQRLTHYRLVIEAGEQLLSQRPKVLRDPRLQGGLQIIPDALRLRLPQLNEPARTPPRPELP